MSVTSNPRGPRDTVEEAWNEKVLTACNRLATHVRVGDFIERLRSFLGTTGRMWVTTSGQAALQECFDRTRAFRGRNKNSVLICSFNCSSVCKAVILAGFVAETFDLADRTGRIDWNEVADNLRSDHHAIVIPHLFGIPTDFRAIRGRAAELGILIVEDCAHTLGGRIDKAAAGTVGDLAIYSFNYNKPITLGGGGAVLINSTELEKLFDMSERRTSPGNELEEVKHFVGYLRSRRSQLGRPSIFSRIRRRLLHQNGTFLEPMPVSGFGPLRAALGIWELDHYKTVCEQRNLNARHFSGVSRWYTWHIDENVTPAWLMQKMIPVEPLDVDTVSRTLQASGLRVGAFHWPTTSDRFLSMKERPNACYVATYGLDVPVHQAMNNDELKFIIDALKSTC